MKIKKTMSAIGHGALFVANVINDGPIITRIDEIDAQIAELQKERTELESKLSKSF